MKVKKEIAKLITLLLIVILSAVLFFVGFPISKIVGVYDVKPTSDLVNYGLDLTGGIYVVLQADESEGAVSSDTLDKAIATIRTRIDSLGVKEPVIAKQGTNKIRISIPDINNQQEALDMIGKTAKLEFVGPDDVVILTGSNVKSSDYSLYTDSLGVSSPSVKLTFDDEGAELFKNATEKFLNQVIEIRLDGEVISDPTVNTQITAGEAYITNIGTQTEAINLATLIRAGALPVNFTAVQVQTIGPTLGQDSLMKSFIGGSIGALLVLLFMLVFYRIPGLAADIALLVYILLFLFAIALMHVTLTLPGIAGIILSIGMAVDANVIIFERIKEEMRLGKSIFSSIDVGFHRALSAIIDSNITTVIAGCSLFFFGSGTIRGFAVTLILGVVVSMFTAVFVSRRLLKTIITVGNIKNPAYFGVRGIE